MEQEKIFEVFFKLNSFYILYVEDLTRVRKYRRRKKNKKSLHTVRILDISDFGHILYEQSSVTFHYLYSMCEFSDIEPSLRQFCSYISYQKQGLCLHT